MTSDAETETTAEQRAAVRRDECRSYGHSFSHVMTGGSLAPQDVFCDNCGASWRIHPDDRSQNFGVSRESSSTTERDPE